MTAEPRRLDELGREPLHPPVDGDVIDSDPALGLASFTAASAEGARMRIPDALAYGLAATAAQQVPDPFPAWTSRLKLAT